MCILTKNKMKMKILKLSIIFSILILLTSCPKPDDLVHDSVSIEFYNHIDENTINL